MNVTEGLLRVRRWVNSREGKPILIAIAGGSCSGKTTLAGQISAQCGVAASVLPLDAYFMDIDDPSLPKDSDGWPLFDVPGSYHGEEFVRHVQQLMQGQRVWSPHYDVPSNQRSFSRGAWVEAAPVVIAEGLFAIRLLEPHFAGLLRIFVTASPKTLLQRRVARDTRRFDIPESLIRRIYLKDVLPCHREFVEPQRQLANLIIETD